MKHRNESLSLLFSLVFAGALVACGDGSGGSSTGGSTSTGGTGAGGATGGTSTGGTSTGGATGGTSTGGTSTGGTTSQGGSGGQGGCHDSSVCGPSEGCIGPEDINCGIPPQEQCFSNADCPGGDVCHSIPDSCSPDHVGSQCGPACAQDSDCGDGFACGSGGSCAPLACDTPGSGCLPSQTCDPASIDPSAPASQRTTGCQKITCQSDGMCPTSTVCVNGYCQTGLGVCMPPAP